MGKPYKGKSVQDLQNIAVIADYKRRLANAESEIRDLRERLEFFSAGGLTDMKVANEIAGHMMLNKNGIEFRRLMRRINKMQTIDFSLRSMWSLGEENEYKALCEQAEKHLAPEDATHES